MDERKALIKVVGEQNFDDDNDVIELTTIGTLEETEESYILRYNEELEPQSAPIKTQLSIQKNRERVELMRSGKHGSLLIIERAKNFLDTCADYRDKLIGIGLCVVGSVKKDAFGIWDNEALAVGEKLAKKMSKNVFLVLSYFLMFDSGVSLFID